MFQKLFQIWLLRSKAISDFWTKAFHGKNSLIKLRNVRTLSPSLFLCLFLCLSLSHTLHLNTHRFSGLQSHWHIHAHTFSQYIKLSFYISMSDTHARTHAHTPINILTHARTHTHTHTHSLSHTHKHSLSGHSGILHLLRSYLESEISIRWQIRNVNKFRQKEKRNFVMEKKIKFMILT